MADVTEIAPDVFRISTYVPDIDLQFNQFLLRGDEPVLFHTGMRGLFDGVRTAVSTLIDPTGLRWIGFSHFEADECGALREWQEIAPEATAVCSVVAKTVSVDDVVAARPARALEDNEVLNTGKHRLRFLQTPHVPHGWDAGLMFEEVTRTLFCSDLLYHRGDVETTTTGDIVGRFRAALAADQVTPFRDPYPLCASSEASYRRLQDLAPQTMAVMHGSTFTGDGSQAIADLVTTLREV